jgi:hypothetical protein
MSKSYILNKTNKVSQIKGSINFNLRLNKETAYFTLNWQKKEIHVA